MLIKMHVNKCLLLLIFFFQEQGPWKAFSFTIQLQNQRIVGAGSTKSSTLRSSSYDNIDRMMASEIASIDPDGTILAPLIRPQSPAARYFASENVEPSILHASEVVQARSAPFPPLLNATKSETEKILTFFSNHLNLLITQTSETSSTSLSDSFIVEGRRLLACKSVLIVPKCEDDVILKLRIFEQIRNLITSNTSDSGIILSPSYKFDSELTPMLRNILNFIGYDSVDILVEEFIDDSDEDERSVLRIIYEGSEVPWGKKVEVQRWRDLMNTIE
ncbi:hypothetical protein TrLO_g11093 [Triparma laevis f. longispina]|uniref:Uncharacterized protein n=1 Tax=Triparma laevis f. longispina TaxID=1714387 RepID=A0A9W7FJ77_9STRA|nr:hypothetical protein TrLO_g11093 [Triparma laevis f. longispina]